VVVVATVRALKMHGGVRLKELGREDVAAVMAGAANLLRHVQNCQTFGLPVVVAINRFVADTAAEMAAVATACESLGVKAIACNHWAEGSAGAAALAAEVVRVTQAPAEFRMLYDDALPLADKIGAASVTFDAAAASRLAAFEAAGYGALPVCMAKTQYSFSTDPTLKAAPSGFTVNIREVRLSAGAGFIVALCGEILTMPGLPRNPAAEEIFVTADGDIGGLS
jgi:formate--tetrahydrofolate ligase